MSKQPHPHLLQAQYDLALLYSKLVRRPGTGCLPSTLAPPDQPPKNTTRPAPRNGTVYLNTAVMRPTDAWKMDGLVT